MTTRALMNVALVAIATGLVAFGGSLASTGPLTGWDWLLAASSIVGIVTAGIGLVRESRS